MTYRDEPLPYPFDGTHGMVLDPVYRELRSRSGLVRVQPPYGNWAWLATRHEDVTAVLESRSFSRAGAAGPDEPRVTAAPLVAGSLLSLDPPEHTPLRRAMAGWFSHRRVRVLRPRIASVVASLLDALAAQGPPADVMTDLARPLSLAVICDVLGVPEPDRARFHEWGGTRREAMWTLSPTGLAAAGKELQEYLAELVARRVADPGEDLISTMLYPADSQHRISEREVATLAGVILAGGYEITANRLGSFVYALVTEPALYQRLRDEPSIVPRAVEELLRYTTLGARVRAEVAVEDTYVGGTLVRAGEAVLPARCSANRDETVFAAPDRIDFDRTHIDHVAFGRGVHYCTGAALSRLELEIGVGGLARRFPGLRLAVPPEEIRWGSVALWAPEALPVTW
jgi:cytochrome P450